MRLGLVAALLGTAAPGLAQIVSSAAPESVGVTVYRNPDRSAEDAINTNWLQGYALITETRRVTIPAGTATLRFEGVAGGILPESAIVTGLPAGVSEKNLDADLLSPRSLYDRSLNRPVTIRRTYPDGRVVEEPAVVRSASAGAMVVQTRNGVEALQCSGLPEAIVYEGVPPGLSAKPTLSVQTASDRAYEATVTLSYLAWGFDWQANYVVERGDNGRARLFAWVTLASSDPTSFPDAGTAVVAGTLERQDRARDRGIEEEAELEVQCEAIDFEQAEARGYDLAAPPPPPPPPMAMAMAADIVVTGARMRQVVQEDLGDLKLYRVPFRTTVAANAQKQVAMIDKAGVPVSIVYTAAIVGDGATGPVITLRTRNRRQEGLGVPLPSGPVAVFERGGGRRLLAGQGFLTDKAVGEDVDVTVGSATQVTLEVDEEESGFIRAVVRNANPWPVAWEAVIPLAAGARIEAPSRPLARKDGQPLWKATLPANGSATLRYRVRSPG